MPLFIDLVFKIGRGLSIDVAFPNHILNVRASASQILPLPSKPIFHFAMHMSTELAPIVPKTPLSHNVCLDRHRDEKMNREKDKTNILTIPTSTAE